eukprot:TRINITY_DN464_c0_g1_i1.p1 TRINITY_DN464_c0_g1~~TRINITY_DN464_c0_g1_i1.p1  ORF type:complete len:201 (+),score=30.83 TRINITY_DN464_c0_g1_i1:81-683(+)
MAAPGSPTPQLTITAAPSSPAPQRNRCRSEKWQNGVISSVGDAPTVTNTLGQEFRFAYRAIKRFGGPRVRLSVGDRVQFLCCNRAGSDLPKVTQVWVVNPGMCIPFSASPASENGTASSSRTPSSESAGSPGYLTINPSAQDSVSATTPSQESPGSSVRWTHNPYSWAMSTCPCDGITYCGDQQLVVGGRTIAYDRFVSV